MIFWFLKRKRNNLYYTRIVMFIGVCGEAVTKIGTVNGLWKFDSTFFGVHPKLADRLDPQIRIMLESTYEAFVDAGAFRRIIIVAHSWRLHIDPYRDNYALYNYAIHAFVAGVNPTSLRGSNTAVVVGTTNNDCADWWSADPDLTNGYEFLGNTRTMFPNRVSFSFDLRGIMTLYYAIVIPWYVDSNR